MLVLAWLLTNAFAVDFVLQPVPGRTPEQHVEYVLSRIGYAQARVVNNVVHVTGDVRIDVGALPPFEALQIQTTIGFAQIGMHATFSHYDLSAAKIELLNVPKKMTISPCGKKLMP